jgi:Skp family chaperone for outer membrane proteins
LGGGVGGSTCKVLEARGRHAVHLDTAFAKYHNDIQEMQAKSDDLVRKNKSLRNKNKGTPLVL